MSNYGTVLRTWRRSIDKTQKDFADAIGCTVSYVSQVERGQRGPLSWDDCAKLIKAFGSVETAQKLRVAANRPHFTFTVSILLDTIEKKNHRIDVAFEPSEDFPYPEFIESCKSALRQVIEIKWFTPKERVG